jgi:hypothetical protein
MSCPHGETDWRACPVCSGVNSYQPAPDPFARALEYRVEQNSELKKVLTRILEKVNKPSGVPLLTTPASLPKSVSDSTPDGVCELCKRRTWLSPSSKRTLENEKDKNFVIICLKCVENESELFWSPRGAQC